MAAPCRQVDDPEVLWSQAMREQELLPAVHCHLGSFALRLKDRVRAPFEYTPMAPMAYTALKGELWCFRYALRPRWVCCAVSLRVRGVPSPACLDLS